MDLSRDATTRDVKRRYAELLKLNRPEDNPGGFQMLRWAYEICLAHADQPAAATARQPVAVFDAPEPEPEPEPNSEPVFEIDVSAFDPRPATEKPAPATNADAPPPRPATAYPWVGLDRLETLRAPAAVVDELLLVGGAKRRQGGQPFDSWYAACPELANFTARDAIERELLERLAQTDARLGHDAFSTLAQSFGWNQIGFERRLHAAGMAPGRIGQAVAALERNFIDGQFAHHLADRDTFFRRAPGDWHKVLGDADRERAHLRRLHDERNEPRRRWLRAIRPDIVNVSNRLFHAYAARYGINAVDHLFGADAVAFWSQAHPGNPPGRVQYALSTIRWLLGFCAFGIVFTLVLTSANDPRLGDALINLWYSVITSALFIAAVTTSWRWLRLVGPARYAQWRARVKEKREPFLQPALALPILVVAGLIVGIKGGDIGLGWISLATLCAVAFVFGRQAVIGAFVLLWFGHGAIVNLIDKSLPADGIGLALLPLVVWACDRLAVITTGGPNAAEGARENRTFWLLLALGFAVLVASAIWGTAPPHG